MLRFEHVSKRYPDAGEALTDVSFHLHRGEMAFLTGRSGAGKSTLLKLIAMMEQCTRGSVLLDGQDITRIGERKIPYMRRNLGLIFQDYKLLNDRTVFDNVALPLVVSGYNHQEVARRVRASLDKVGLLGKERKHPLALSGGEQQRVGIARAIVNKPKLILADEPTGNLDPDLSAEVMFMFEQFKQVGVTVLIASHDIELINHLGHRVLTLDKGHLIAS
ncbi:cell division ATP-binding protein FtsE [Methylomonas sp. EFPC1]|uniref:Cell division ATP-binding protein FtsE n=1 Tax=Methylomonas defluvii TaxID=3045149 RepID=A0ABU4UK39_9GAMM|nr:MULTISPECIES: cell division ATP-binding protein FtsE [unclassified Methylomonas]MDX8129190.1 cell division ATP-binding protein FtsE [Methylomonas sp. OY6]NOV29959.1 cell division ATP-binding protein FtsE [Methylomonas sp. ZR1]PKD41512.1 cell division ATP-binding protein FtsE [Methylomonas sp. Kb3]QBC27214.1 cell division ATP-binding protein FtsE [Methylomonas sp. LW13]QSA99703.1 cell division ATP-binding protein FtsE [Methylomonas sp. EFPC1]